MSPSTTTLRAILSEQAQKQPRQTFFIAPESGFTADYASLLASARNLAGWLAAHGHPPGSHIAWLLPNGAQNVRLLVSCIAAGYVATPLSLLAQPAQLAYLIEHSEARVVFVSTEWLPHLQQALQTLRSAPEICLVDPDAVCLGEEPQQADWPHPAAAADAPALLMYTSGTTGKPKGVVLSQRNVITGALAVSRAHALGPQDRVLAVLPLYHINAQIVTVLAPLAHGGSLVMPQRYSTSKFWQTALQYQCTWLNLVPTIIAFLLTSPPDDRDRLAGEHFRFCRSASAPLPAAQQQAFEARFGLGVIETMGLTETAAPSFSNPLDPARRKQGSPGQACGCEARIADPEHGQTLADGIEGEIQIRGDNVMLGYLKDPAATAAAFSADGWLRTGDLGRRDADGFYFITGRLKELIIKGGENIAPREIDEALLRHPDVQEAAAVGIPDPVYGQEIIAGVVLKPETTADAASIKAHCIATLGPFKSPRQIHILAALPKGPSGKIQRLKLLENLPPAN